MADLLVALEDKHSCPELLEALAALEILRAEFNTLNELYSESLSRAEAAERERDALRALSIRVEVGGITYNFDKALATIPGGANIDNVTVKINNMELTDEWRPVTGDDLPEDHDEALVTVENDDGYRFVDMAEFTVGGVWWQHVDTGWRELKRVTHWRPLPPPPAATE